MGRLVEASQPKASVQGTRMLLMLTPPDSVRRRPILSQLWANLVRWLGLLVDDHGGENLLHSVLPGIDEGEDVVVGAFENTF
jgi:hypothetical protein